MSHLQLHQLENTWEASISKGNNLFQSSAFTKAYSHYMQAVVASEVLMENIAADTQHALRVPGMYYVACINLAKNYWGMQDVENAKDYFFYCTYKLKLLADKTAPDLLLKQTATVYWQKAVQAYKEFADITGTHIPFDLNENETYEQLQKLKLLFNVPKERLN